MTVEGHLYGAKELRFALGGREVLQVPSWHIGRGGVTCLVGPNGSGKTSLLSLLAGIAVPTGGELFFEGGSTADGTHRRKMRRHVTYVHQSPYLFRGTVGANVVFGLKVRGTPRGLRRRLAEEALRQVGLAGMAGRSGRELSGGEVKRVALARAVAFSPAVFLLDEPTANVDSTSVRMLEDLILRLSEDEGRSVIFATHDLGQAHRLTERVFFLNEGRIHSSPVRNLFRGVVRRGAKGLLFDTGRATFTVADGRPGATGQVSIDEKAINVSGRDSGGAADNRLAGRVKAMEEETGAVRVDIDAGEIIAVRLSREHIEAEGLTPGRRVFVAFPAEAVRIF